MAQVSASEIAAALKEIRGPLEVYLQEHPNSPLKSAWTGVEKMQAILNGDYRALWLSAQKEIADKAAEIDALRSQVNAWENGCIRPNQSAVVRALLAAREPTLAPPRFAADHTVLAAALRALRSKPIPQSPPLSATPAPPPTEAHGDDDLYS